MPWRIQTRQTILTSKTEPHKNNNLPFMFHRQATTRLTTKNWTTALQCRQSFSDNNSTCNVRQETYILDGDKAIETFALNGMWMRNLHPWRWQSNRDIRPWWNVDERQQQFQLQEDAQSGQTRHQLYSAGDQIHSTCHQCVPWSTDNRHCHASHLIHIHTHIRVFINSLPLNCQTAPSFNTFKIRLKTFLFDSA